MLTAEGCHVRLERLCHEFSTRNIDAAILSDYRSVYYLSGNFRETTSPQLMFVGVDGKTLLVTDSRTISCVADEVIEYQSYSIQWPVSFQSVQSKALDALRVALAKLPGTVKRIALEKDRVGALILEAIRESRPSVEIVDAAPVLGTLRRRKLPDELALIRQCVRCIEAGYSAVRKVLRPGLTELNIFNELHGEVVCSAGYSLKFEGDFACGIRAITESGSPLRLEIRPGDLYILDIYPSFQGYHADLCRTFAVSPPTDLQWRAWETVRAALESAEKQIRPGVPARQIWHAVRECIDTFEPARGSFRHHAGHGVGLDGWEPPWMIPGSDDLFEAGDVISVEPGCYAQSLQGGVRLEHTYVVTEDGIERLSQFPLDL